MIFLFNLYSIIYSATNHPAIYNSRSKNIVSTDRKYLKLDAYLEKDLPLCAKSN